MADRLTPNSSANERIKRYLERSRFEIPTSSDESFRGILSNIASTERAKTGLRALGEEPKPRNRQGILSRLFSQEKGILTAPARAVTAFGSATLGGIGDVNKELEGMNPFEAAYKSAIKGQFAITGGDIIRVNDNDPFAERLAKWAGALAIDLTTDPVNYVGPVNLFTRKGSAVLAVRGGSEMLAVADDLLKQAGRAEESASLVDNLFTKTRMASAADAQRKLKVAITPGSPLDILKMDANGVVSSTVKAQHAGSQMGLIVGEALLTGGRPKIRRTVAELLGSDDLAKQFMERLPAEVSGGVWLKNPISGRPLKKIAGGVGAGGPAVEAVNRARFATTASAPVNFFTENFAGKSGVAYAKVKRGLLPKSKLSDVERTTLLDFVTFKKAMSERNIILTQLGTDQLRLITGALSTQRRFTEQADKDAFSAAFKSTFHSPSAPLSATMSEAQREGVAAAANLRNAIMKAHANLKAAGIEVGDLGPDFSPLILTDKAYERRLNRGYLGGNKTEDLVYTGQRRSTFGEMSEDPEYRAILGADAPDRPNVVLLNSVAANDRLRKAGKLAADELEFEEDPIKIVETYLNWANGAVAAKKFADTAAATGAILRFPSETRTIIDTVEASSFLSAVGRIAPAVAKKVEDLKTELDRRLREALDPGVLEKVQADVTVRRGETLTTYRDAKLAEQAATGELIRANRALEAAADRLRQPTTEAMSAAGRANVDALVSEAERVYGNARSRLSKAADRADESARSYESLASGLELPGPVSPDPELQAWYDTLVDADATALQARRKVDEEIVSNQQARQELTAAREIRQTTYEQMNEAQRRNFDLYEEALVAQDRAAQAATQARTRRQAALADARAAAEDTVITRATALNDIVDAYTGAKYRYLEIRAAISKPYKLMSEAERATIETARKNMIDASSRMKSMLGYATKRGGAGAEYARTIVRLAEKLPEAQLEAARVIANTRRLNAFIDGLSDFTREDALDQLGNMYNTYKGIRRYVGEDELRDLARTERAVLAGPFAKLTRTKEDMSKAAEELYSETGIAKIGSGTKNAKITLPKSLRDSFAPDGVRTAMERLYRAEQDPSEFQQWMARIYDPAALVWKTAVTVGRGPGYSFTNLVGALVNNFLARISVKSHRISAAMINMMQEVIRDVQKSNPNLSYFEMIPIARDRLEKELGGVRVGDKSVVDLFVDFLERGGHFSTDIFFQMAELQRLGLSATEPLTRQAGIQYRFDDAPSGKIADKYQAAVTFLLSNPVQRSFNDLAQLSELFPRFAAYVDGYTRFGDLDSAMDLVHMLHFDYQDLSDVEIWFKRFIPFYTWTRNNIPLQLRAAFLASDQVAKLYNANAEVKEAFDIDGEAAWLNEYLPDYMEINGGFASYINTGAGYLGLFPKLPMQDADRLFGTAFIGGIPIPIPRRDALISSLGPVVKTPVEFVTGRNFELGYEYGSDIELLEGQARTLLPYYGTAKRVLSAAGLPVDKERQLSNLLNVLVGAPYGATTINEKSLRQGARQSSEEVNSQLRAAAEDANVDIDWLRKQVKDGVPLYQLTLMIASGQGTPERQTLAKKIDEMTKKQGSGPDYSGTLQNLRRGPGIPTLGL